jgi:hypothetical protein
MSVDPVSGNEIPAGVSAENVRDDIDAKLSADEYVATAQAVKFHGLAKYEAMNAQAQKGMEEMEENDRIKTVEPSLEEEVEAFAEGGMVNDTDIDTLVQKVKAAMATNPNIGKSLSKMGVTFAEGGAVTPSTFDPTQWTTPGISNFNSEDSDSVTEYRIFVDSYGNRVSIPFKDGSAQIAIPQGYSSEKAAESEVKPQEHGEGPANTDPPTGVDYTTWSDADLEAATGKTAFTDDFLGGAFKNSGIGKVLGFVNTLNVKDVNKEIDRRVSDPAVTGKSVTGGPRGTGERAPSKTKTAAVNTNTAQKSVGAPSDSAKSAASYSGFNQATGVHGMNKGGFLKKPKGSNKPTY